MSPQLQAGTLRGVRTSEPDLARPSDPVPIGAARTSVAAADTQVDGSIVERQATSDVTTNSAPAGDARTIRLPIGDTVMRRAVIGPSSRSQPGSAPVTDGALALSLGIAPELPAVPALPPPPTLRLVGTVEAQPDTFPDIFGWAPRLVQAVAEVVSGDRPIGQLIRWTDSDVYADLHRRVRVLGLTTTASGRGSEDRAVVRSVHVCYPKPGVAEVAAHVRHGGRSRAVALRLEVHRSRWVCTALRIG